jgi:hypothetical protein
VSLFRTLAMAGSSLAAALLVVPAPALAKPTGHVRGTVTAVSATQLTLATAHGPLSLSITPATRVAGLVRGSAAEITPGTFIGVANVPTGTVARALEVVIFPAMMKGTGEGDYPWDLPAGGHASAMTNGTVGMGGGSSMMTNASVTGISGGHGPLVVHLAYKGGTKVIAIPPNVPIVRIVRGNLGLVTPGKRVFVIVDHDVAFRINVGEHGVVPPM